MIDKIKCDRRVGNDIHGGLIAMFKELQGGWEPPMHISEDEYNLVKNNKFNYPDHYVAFVGFCGSFAAKYWGGYARAVKADRLTPRDMPNEAIKNLLNQLPSLQSVEFISGSYLRFPREKIKNCVIYCDPPYRDTTKYSTDAFNHDEFWQWVKDLSVDNYVLVSEYTSPDDFEKILSKDVTTSLKVVEHENRTEGLFTFIGGKYYNKYVIL